MNKNYCKQCGEEVSSHIMIRRGGVCGKCDTVNYYESKKMYDRWHKCKHGNYINGDDYCDLCISEKRSKKQEGCYIATTCYGNYNSKEVILFRKYRDTVLNNNIGGRIFITVYYFLSPPIAVRLKNYSKINNFIKTKILDKIYNKLNRRFDRQN